MGSGANNTPMNLNLNNLSSVNNNVLNGLNSAGGINLNRYTMNNSQVPLQGNLGKLQELSKINGLLDQELIKLGGKSQGITPNIPTNNLGINNFNPMSGLNPMMPGNPGNTLELNSLIGSQLKTSPQFPQFLSVNSQVSNSNNKYISGYQKNPINHNGENYPLCIRREG